MRVVVILGPPAVGKMSVGLALSERTGWPLLHNHVVADMLNAYFVRGTRSHTKLTSRITELLVTEIYRTGGDGLILTRAHVYGDPQDEEMMSLLVRVLPNVDFTFVELSAALDVRLQRNRTSLRLAHKPSKRDLDASDARVRANDVRRFLVEGPLPWTGQRLRIDNTSMAPDQVALRIVEELP